MFAAAAITIIFSVINIVINPKGIKKGIIALVGAVVIIIIAYLMADDTVLEMPYFTGKGNDPTTLKWVDTGMFTAYILVALAFLAIIWSSVSRIFK